MERRHWLALSALALWLGCSAGPPEPSTTERPNVLLIVVDTLRADRLSYYGHDRQTSPRTEAEIADKGVVFEHAYAQAPWTIPSVASLLTGLDPATFLDENGKPWGLPEQAETLAELLADAGYTTHAFIANPTVHGGNGFAQGFQTFETAPYDLKSLGLHADFWNKKILDHLGFSETSAPDRQLEEPFFLYAHYLDPHDPYDNPWIQEGKSEFFPEYRGTVKGSDVHGLYLGKLEMKDPEQDVKQLRALYDSEVHYVDHHIGELLEAIPPEILGRTLVVLTSDHGEELFEHGGWKHGESVYQEQIHVPLVFRWDGRIPAGLRVEQTVRLLDVLPTILESAEALTAERKLLLDGRSLWRALRGDELPELPAFSRHHTDGPLRAAEIRGSRKEILFDREAEYEPRTEREQTFLTLDRRRMRRAEAYDLEADPLEQNDLANPQGGNHRSDSVGTGVLAGLDPFLEGLRLMVVASQGSAIEGRIELEREARGVKRWFLSEEDSVYIEGSSVSFRFEGDDIAKGVTIEGPVGAIRSLSLEPPEAIDVRWAGLRDEPALPVGLRTLLVEQFPMGLSNDRSTLYIWLRQPREPVGEGLRDAETLRRLKALGYAD